MHFVGCKQPVEIPILRHNLVSNFLSKMHSAAVPENCGNDRDLPRRRLERRSDARHTVERGRHGGRAWTTVSDLHELPQRTTPHNRRNSLPPPNEEGRIGSKDRLKTNILVEAVLDEVLERPGDQIVYPPPRSLKASESDLYSTQPASARNSLANKPRNIDDCIPNLQALVERGKRFSRASQSRPAINEEGKTISFQSRTSLQGAALGGTPR
jgi:hypothetical protein